MTAWAEDVPETTWEGKSVFIVWEMKMALVSATDLPRKVENAPRTAQEVDKGGETISFIALG